jgi:hypothetical protein
MSNYHLGRHDCVSLINNFISKKDLEHYAKVQGMFKVMLIMICNKNFYSGLHCRLNWQIWDVLIFLLKLLSACLSYLSHRS